MRSPGVVSQLTLANLRWHSLGVYGQRAESGRHKVKRGDQLASKCSRACMSCQ